MAEELVFQYGYAGLFLVSFIAATFFPLGSEVFVIMMIATGFNPVIIFITATAGNSAGAVLNYYTGKFGTDFILSKYLNVSPNKKIKAESLFQKWGSPILFFAWLPIIGDPLTFVAGIFHTKLQTFLFWVITGKAFRYGFIIFFANKSISENILQNTLYICCFQLKT